MFKKRARPAEGLRSAATSAEGDAAEECVALPTAAVKLSGLVSSSAKAKASDSVVTSFESTRSAVSAVSSLVDLAAENEELEEDRAREARDAQAKSEAASDPSIYRGKGAYHEYVQKREKIDKKACALGPIRAPTSIKTSSVFDYKPDVCKVSARAAAARFAAAAHARARTTRRLATALSATPASSRTCARTIRRVGKSSVIGTKR
jgi:hypothetical protein